MTPLRIAMYGNAPFVASGYGKQADLFAPRFAAAGHKVALQCFDGLAGSVLAWKGVDIYPKAAHSHALDVLPLMMELHDADFLLTLMDLHVLDIRVFGDRWAAWCPVDTEPISPPVLGRLKRAWMPIMMSRHGLEQARENGLDARYVPLAVDTSVYKPADRRAARERLGIPVDAFVVGMVADNKDFPCRKAFAEHIEAFARLKKRHADAVMYLHTTAGATRGGLDLPVFAQINGLRPNVDVMFCDQYRLTFGFPDEHMADTYRAMDVCALASSGEGFGLSLIEAQACGTPVIAGDWTATGELAHAGWRIPKDCAERFYLPVGAYRYVVHVGALLDRMEWAYRKARDEKMAAKAVEFARQYDVEEVMQRYWQPVLEEIAAKVADVPAPQVIAEAWAA